MKPKPNITKTQKFHKTLPVLVELSRNVQSKNALNMINIDKCT